MSLITVSGEPGSRHEEVARLAAQRLSFELITDTRLEGWIHREFSHVALPEEAWRHVATSMLARLATEQHLMISSAGAERLFPDVRTVLRIRIAAPESVRIGALMVDHHLDRDTAKARLRGRVRGGRHVRSAKAFDVVLNGAHLTTDDMAEILATTARITGLDKAGMLPFSVEAQLQFQARLALAGHGVPPPGVVTIKRRHFSHPSEEIFANLLDFYRIAWDYEPRSFPIEVAPDGRVIEAFTPDFYLPEFDTYVELTTMKQSLVTKKNRKIKMLKQLYPGIRIQIFYQKDFDNLVFKHGLEGKADPAA